MKKIVLLLLFVSATIFAQEQGNTETPAGGAFKEVTDVEVKTKQRVIKLSKGELFAYPAKQGYNLIDGDNKTIFEILKVNVQDLYIIKDKNGVFYKNGDIWYAEYYKDGKNAKEKFKLKF